MTDSSVNEGLLVAYADGQLGSDDIAIVEAAISADPSLQARVDKFKQSGQLLKSSIDIENQVTPDHIIHRFREIELSVKRRRQLAIRNTPKLSFISWRFLFSIGGSFAAGLACAVFVISPGLMTVSNNQGSPQPIGYTEQIVMRGSGALEGPYIEQGGVEIASGESIKAGVPFKLRYKSPISGRYDIWEVVSKSASCRPTDVLALSQGGTKWGGGQVGESEYISSRSLKIEDQETLRLRITVISNVNSITHDLVFCVTN